MDWLFEDEYRWVLVFFILAFMFLVVAIAYGSLFCWARKKIRKSTQTTTATVIDQVVRVERKGVGIYSSKTKVYYEIYEWVANGVRYEQVSVTGSEIAPRHAIGDKVEAYYSHEEQNKIITKTDGKEDKDFFILWSFACVICILIGLVFKFTA